MDKIEYRAVIKFLTKEGVAPKDINDRLRAVYGVLAPSYATVKLWAKQFKWGRESLEDDPHTGRPIEATASDVVQKIEHHVHESSNERESVSSNVCSRWIPRTLNKSQKEERISAAHEFFELLEWNETDTFERIVTGEETWIHYYDPELKSQTMEWHKRGEPASKVPRKQIATKKVMASVFWDAKGILLVEFLPKNTTVTGYYYAKQIHRLRKAIREKLPGKKLYSPDLPPSDYFLFPNTKRYLKGKQYESEEEISNEIFNVWEDKDAEWFEGGIKALKHRYESVIRVHGDYFV
ncbi:histone-lysine N-methyltransferase SETMAR-like [Contarinia nasturtii]|uniref:histone-lysine N-methyltransferase SETMAR-like n=1 Tax=Contarinia nasturtii TaxID=265458 RepID=UPI0012D46EEC|nr:histone-lysine N-methyltransferase SETMAR-like [Contarinia nasturtii]